ncbi:MAG: glutaminyl-peptide cyclotransferase [Trueperaceae bacterium]|nr:glutaminyl-peptide cyclotransferase [Trueperaceae bacterium]
MSSCRASARRLALAPALALVASLLLSACGSSPPTELSAEEVARYPHDAAAFTQGLVWHDGALYESTGLYGESSLRRVDLDTGAVDEIRYLDADVFAEGLARVGDTLVQLTWRAQRAYRWPLGGFARGDPPQSVHTYQGEGWGLCHDGERLVRSDGTPRLTFHDPDDFRSLGSVDVTVGGEPLPRLNELECVGDAIWANVWYEDRIVRIDPSSGRVEAWLDLSGLLTPAQRAEVGPQGVLNGLAWRSDTETMLVTGKLWPVVVELRIAGFSD